ncbi:hypothetical protein BVC71_00360 [Marivivens niveibacter]|uniref:Uncharacterized protein n=1 Tax=Marivivens niveibacter TaxID=1930667 RepID=A0A251WZU3_9RHOB|nr:hypothetical protein [Marivivens niveibacter]OUD10010.1 hypothetical protein BVC71_00360 [Marivivens niveibacter]
MATVIVTVFLTALTAYLAQNYFATLSARAAHMRDHVEEFSKIESLAVEYWSNRSADDVNKDKVLSARLLGAVTASSFFSSEATRLLGNLEEEYIELDVAVYDAATGGDFQAADRDPDPARVTEVIKCCTEMRNLLRRASCRLYWAR